jgi:hypothetical protein
MLTGEGPTWEALEEADLIVGGLEFDADFM